MKHLILTSIFVLAAAVCPAREYHVAKTGSDAADGSAMNPLKTINAAAQIARPGDTVTVHQGIYRESVDPRYSGTKEARILYRAAEGEEVELKGSEPVTGWKRLKKNSDVWTATVPNTVFGNFNPFNEVFMGDWLFTPCELHLGEVFLNGVSMYEAVSADSLQTVRKSHRDPDGVTLNWHADVEADNTVITACFGGLDPNKENVEITTRTTCFYPSREGIGYITLRGFKIGQAAARWAAPTAEQVGMVAVHWAKGWIIEDNEIYGSKSTGITLGKEAGTGDNVWTFDSRFDGAIHYLECIFKVLRHGWNKENIGSHVIRNNYIHDCGQAGICGSMGCAFSEVYGNEIMSICNKDEFSGCEQGGIKFHGGLDTYIHDNNIHGCIRGIWMDWMGQGSRISSNVLYDNWDQDLFYEMDHGPYVVDNNIFLSNRAFLDLSEGGAFIHNFFGGYLDVHPDSRYVPYMLAHSTEVKGVCTIDQADDRFVGNVFLSVEGHENPLGGYEKSPNAIVSEDNVTVDKSNVEVSFEGTRAILKIKGLSANCPAVDSGTLGVARLSGYRYENADGTPLSFNQSLPGPSIK